MANLLDNLQSLLQKDEKLVSKDELLKNKIIELALKLDKGLIKLLLSDKKIKEVFFTKVDKTLIFGKDKFLLFVSSKEFLPDSYTAFKNKIGLITKDEFLTQQKEVVLAWPYKDCVLEGGMTKEDQKRFLLDCLDKNHLYVNYSESEEDKKINKKFYEKPSSSIHN